MFFSAECRWFFEGELPGDMQAWFGRDSLGVSSPERADDYLVLPGCSTTSVKLREGRFEVKVITGVPEEFAGSGDIAGTRDSWTKWSREIGDPGVAQSLMAGDDARWVRVSKQRDLRLVSLDDDAPREIEPNTVRLNNGCQFELTRIRLFDKPWWSFSFEAFGQPEATRRNLERGMDFVFRDPPPLSLPMESSMSYPHWLMQCTQHS